MKSCARRSGKRDQKNTLVEVLGFPLIHDKTVDEWGTAVLVYFMTGPPANAGG
jgi:hypothetical protein